MVSRRKTLITIVMLGTLSFAGPRVSHADPDLRPEIANVTVRLGQSVNPADVAEGCAGGAANRTLLAFDHTAWNDGPSNLSLGDPGCPDCESVPNPVCSNPLFECSLAGGHNHAHLRNFSDYSVTAQGSSEVIVRGHKEGFCLVNSTCLPTIPTPAPGGSCNELSAGCGDFYGSGLGCQYVDVTGLRPGKYTLRVELNPLRTIQEASYLNNVQTYDFEICTRKKGSVSLTVGLGAPKYQNKRPLTLQASIEFSSEKELRSMDPLKDGLGLALSLDGREALGYGATLPAGEVGKGCYPHDGWKRHGKNKWTFRSESGLDPLCNYQMSSGIQTLTIERRGKRLLVSLRARVEPTSVPPTPKGGRVQFAIAGVAQDASNDTCGASVSIKKCTRGGLGNTLTVCH